MQSLHIQYILKEINIYIRNFYRLIVNIFNGEDCF